MFNFAVDRALHHRAAVVVFNVAFPARLYHKAFTPRRILLETLFTEVLDRVVVRIRQEVVDIALDRMVFELVHQPSPISFYLLSGRDSKENNFSKFLIGERTEHAPTQNDRFLSLNFLHDYHGFVDAVHYKAHDVGSWHPGQLLCDDIFEVNEIAHRFERPKFLKDFRKLNITYLSLRTTLNEIMP